MKNLTVSFLCFLLFSVQNAYSESVSSEVVSSQKLAEKIARLTTHRASFQQTVVEEDGYILDENNGVMSFEQPGKLYWNVLEPFPNLLVSDGDKVYFYDPDLDQVTIRNWSSDPSENPVAVFIGEAAISDYYSVEEVNGLFTLEPKNTDSGFSEIKIEFDKDVPETMTIVDTLGQITTMRFSAIDEQGDKNGKIPNNPYTFEIPVTAEVINDS